MYFCCIDIFYCVLKHFQIVGNLLLILERHVQMLHMRDLPVVSLKIPNYSKGALVNFQEGI